MRKYRSVRGETLRLTV